MQSFTRIAFVATGVLALAGCSSGGGSSATSGSSGSSGSGSVTGSVSAGAGAVTVSAPAAPSLNGNTLAAASTGGPNFITNAPPNGTVFALNQSVLQVSPGSVTSYTPSGGATITQQGSQAVSGGTQGVFELKVPSLSLDVPGLITDGTRVTQSSGAQASLVATNLNLSYTLLESWAATPASGGTAYIAFGFSGYQTPSANVPKTGSGNYASNAQHGGLIGVVIGGSSSGATLGTLSGDIGVQVNFATNVVGGLFSSISVTPSGGTAVGWNNVVLAGTLSGAAIAGTTTATAGSGTQGSLTFANSSTGSFSGALTGPNAEEVGGTWTLFDGSGSGKTAVGFFGGLK